LLTLHAAKGLEFPLVFIAGCEDGFVPLTLAGPQGSDFEEERRLFYVGMTRAKRRLVLTETKKRVVRGAAVERTACPFLEGLPADLITSVDVPSARRRTGQQLSLGW
jgi:superfamily I DNA/RNA helicase